MGTKCSREGLHYKSSGPKNDRKNYTIEEITIESTGISKDDIGFPAANQKVKRIITRIKEFTGRADLGLLKFRPEIIRIVEKAYRSEYGIDNLKMMLNNKFELVASGDSGGEDEILPMLSFIETVVGIPTVNQSCFQKESQEFKDIVGKITAKVFADMLFLSENVDDNDKKMKLLMEYFYDLRDENQTGFFESWRSTIRQIVNAEFDRLIDEDGSYKRKQNN